MPISAQDVQAAAFLSAAAYEHTSAAVQNYLGAAWDVQEFFENEDAAGFFSTSGDTLALIFRGTDPETLSDDQLADLGDAILRQGQHFALLETLINHALIYANGDPNITRLIVAGHSLGGMMAEYFATQPNPFLDVLVANNVTVNIVSFGSPGIEISTSSALAQSTLSIVHAGDPVGTGTVLSILGITNPFVHNGAAIEIELPFIQDTISAEHSRFRYLETARIITESTAGVWGSLPNSSIIVGNNDRSDNLEGGSSVDYVLGGSGDDVLTGKAANDTIDGGDGIDTAAFQFAIGDLVGIGQFSGFYTIARYGGKVTVSAKPPLTEGTDTLYGVEFLQFTDRTIDILNDLPDLSAGTAVGGHASDGGVAPPGSGSSGNDGTTPSSPPSGAAKVGDDSANHLYGTNGPDIFEGNGGDDVLTGYSGLDTFDGGEGSDTVDYSYNPASVSGTVDLTADTAFFPGFHTEQLISIENVWMGAGSDTIIGDAGDNDLRGGPGNDTLTGGLGNDKIYGDWKFSDQGGIDTAIVPYTFASGYTVSGSAAALHIVGAEGDDWYYNVERFEFAGDTTKTVAEVLQAAGGIANSGSGPIAILTSNRTVAESAPVGAAVSTLTAVNSDVTDTFTFALADAANSPFEIVGNQLRIKSGSHLDYEAANSHDLTIQVVDGAGNIFSRDLTIFVQDVVTGVTPARVSGDNVLVGTSAEDVLRGDDLEALKDSIRSQLTGPPFIVYNPGNDTLTGGGGGDSFQYETGDWGNDTIIDFALTEDRISFVGTFAVLTPGDLTFDADSAGQLVISNGISSITLAGVQLDDLESVRIDFQRKIPDSDIIGIADADTIVGTTGGNIIFGGDGDDVLGSIFGENPSGEPSETARQWILRSLSGFAGSDTFIGGPGDDVIGGLNDGTSIYYLNWDDYNVQSNGTDVIVSAKRGTEGTDTLRQVPHIKFADHTVEVAALMGHGDAILVNEDSPIGGNLLADNGFGLDRAPDGDALSVIAVDGASSNVGRTLALASGALIVVNSDGRFVYDPNGAFESLHSGQTGADSFTYTISDGQGHSDTAIVNITITGQDDGLVVAGGPGDEHIIGTPQDDQIDGGDGNDTIQGGAGFDWLQGGPGADVLDGHDDSDVLDGGEGNDTLSGGAGSDWLIGGPGSDTMTGGPGNNVIDGGGNPVGNPDQVLYTQSPTSVSVDLSAGTASDGLGGVDTLIGIEGVIGSPFADTLIGSSAGNEVLEGNAGNDLIDGGGNSDGSPFGDFAQYTNFALSGVVVALSEGMAADGQGGTDTLVAIQSVNGSQFDDIVVGNASPNLLRGFGGADRMFGRDGNDQLEGGQGNDTIDGGAGNDLIDGQDGTDTAIFSGNRADYSITGTAGAMTIMDGVADRDGTDAVHNVEFLQLADGIVPVSELFNQAPMITSNGGGDTATVSVAENSAAAATVTAIDPDAGQTLAFSIAGGVDAALFTIDSTTGALAFVSAPDFEAPTDAGSDNTYEVTVQVSDGNGGTDTQAISVSVTNLAGISPPPSNAAAIIGTDEEDVLTGLGGANNIQGLGGNNVLLGGGGNDTLRGGLGADVLDGGAGSDFASYAASATDIIASLADPASNTGEAFGDIYISIESLRGSNFDDTLIGDGSNNLLQGAAGADHLDGRGGADYADYRNSLVGLTVDLGNPANNTGEATDDTYVSIENIRGSAFNDTLVGNGSNNTLRGGLGADTLNGGAGSDFASYSDATTDIFASLADPASNTGEAFGDTYISIEHLRGGNFNDTLVGDGNNNLLNGGPGADVLDGGAGFDLADYTNATAGLIVDFANPANNTGEAAGDACISIEGIRGSGFDDILIAGNALSISELRGGLGADALIGGTGFDYASYRNSTAALSISLASSSSNTGEAAGDSYTSIEGLIGSDFNDTLTGDAGRNWLVGGTGFDTLDGQSGIDIASYHTASSGVVADLATPANNTGDALGDVYISIEGLGGSRFDDTLTGDEGDNSLRGQGGADVLDGGAGSDTAEYFNSPSGLTADLATPVNNTGEAFGDSYISIENLSGSTFSDVLRGDGNANVLSGADGNDQLEGNGGDDRLVGGAGDDILNGQDDIDTAAFSGNRADYSVSGSPAEFTISDSVANRDGTDTVRNVEFVQFADGVVAVGDLVNQAPLITSNGGGDTAAVSVAENSAAVTTVTSIDPDAGQAPAFSIAGGVDAALFTIDSTTGALAFISLPDFEVPTDADSDNTYDVTVQVSDGNGGTDTQAISVSVTNLAGISPLPTNAATIIGTDEEDVLTGLGGANNIQGLGGNDILSGAGGADTLDGGTGSDTLVGGTGNDTLSGGTGNDTFNYTFGDGADVIDGEADSDTLNIIGTAAANLLDVIFDGTSITNFEGGTVTGVESIMADLLAGVDTLTYAGTTAEITVNLATSSASGLASITGIENATGASGNDTLTGDADDNILNGGAGAGNDVLTGGGGNDTLIGGGGNDAFIATINDGNDTYTGGGGSDTYDLSGTTAGATITTTSSSSTQTGTDVLSVVNIIGSQGNDTITVNGGANFIDGQDGDDIIDAGGGNDTLDGGEGDDILIGGTGSDTVNGAAGNDTIFWTFGDGPPTIDGGADTDTLEIIGTAAANVLDVIFDGTSITNFEGGTVTGVEAINADLLGGNDRLSYAGATADVTVDLAAGTASGFASISNIENVTGGSGNDVLSAAGNAQNNNLAGGVGDDTYFVDSGDTTTEAANAGIDSVFTASAAFVLANNVDNLTFTGVGNFAGTGNGLANTVTGGAGDDVLSGGGGTDTLIGGAGNDAMTGGAGNDRFIFTAGFGSDTITGFDANPTGGQDLLDVSGLGIDASNFGGRVSIVDLGADTLVMIDGTDTITLLGVNGVGANAITQADFIV